MNESQSIENEVTEIQIEEVQSAENQVTEVLSTENQTNEVQTTDIPVTATTTTDNPVTFESLGVCDAIVEGCKSLGWTRPTEIQEKALPFALAGRDIIGLAQTGSGKTGAFVIPILQALQKAPQRLFALILTPTRELAIQISDQFNVLGHFMDVKSVIIFGGVDLKQQRQKLSENPHIIIATPGRLVDHLENSRKSFLSSIKFLVMDEADRLLGLDFEVELDKILDSCPYDRRTYLFSATMTSKVDKLQRASLRNAELVKVSDKFDTVETLSQYEVYVPIGKRVSYLVQLIVELGESSMIIFCLTCKESHLIAQILRNLSFPSIAMNGKMSQPLRLKALNNFKSHKRSILVATDLASRGLDISHVEVVVNFNMPASQKEYCHRVGRTARAGRMGKAFTLLGLNEKAAWDELKEKLGKSIPRYKPDVDKIKETFQDVQEATLLAEHAMENHTDKRGFKRKGSHVQTKHKFKRNRN